MLATYHFRPGLYSGHIYLLDGDVDEARAWVQKRYGIASPINPSWCGWAAQLTSPTGGLHYIIWLEKFAVTQYDLACLAHECVHITDYILDDSGIRHDYENGDTYAYLYQDVFKKALKALGVKK